jgi:glycosyltransferase involved in cell wall biosynthesis
VFVLTSHIEANPVSILEAMSVGRPVVATRVGSIHEAVADGKTGYLAPPNDGSALADRVLQLLRNPRLSRSLGAAGRQAVISRWSLAAMVQGYERLIEAIYLRKRLAVRC